MARWGMTIDIDRCTGCGSCVAACQAENNVPVASLEQVRVGRSMSWVRMVEEVEGTFPDAHVKSYPRLCMHCDHAPCVNVCPVHATYLAADGIIAQIYPQCIGCRYCMAACPYVAKTFNWFQAEETEARRVAANPDVSLRPVGVVEKCTFCSHRLQKAKEQARFESRPLRSEDYQPACVETCPADAMVFGDLEDEASRVARLSRSPRAERMHEDLGTEPKVFYLRSRTKHES